AETVTARAKTHGAEVTTYRGEDASFEDAFPLIHAVGRASTRPPRLIDLVWGQADAPQITLVGKGICFDTGGLDIKPAQAMLLMKKDMGGAASAIASAHIIMALGLPVRLRLIISTAENSVGGDAFRPGDVITSRAGKTVEIGNTDAEGRLVLADALTLADEEAPDLLLTFATLTGAARVALGPDLPAFFSTDDEWANRITREGLEIADPVWRMPFWAGYNRLLESDTADFNNVSSGPFAGAITAALFLKKFVTNAKAYAHVDMFGWRPAKRALGPKGGEVHAARAVAAAVEGFARNA
ncbi:MAG: leucyl aminopeptidase family protein, partial [Pseudomonadota bacterium]